MKKLLINIFIILMLLGMSACGKSAENNSEKTEVVCTVFPLYDWTRELLKGCDEDYEITYLLTAGTDLHSFQPTMADMAKISSCDIFIYVGGESDEWAEDALANSVNKNMKVLNLSDYLGETLFDEELKEGMQGVPEGGAKDEHIWLSIRNAISLTNYIAEALGDDGAVKKNKEAYIEKLQALDGEYKECMESAKNTTLIFADRFPFRYLIEDYHLDYFAAFNGCSAESEASFDTVIFLSDKIREYNPSFILVTESGSKSISDAINSAAGTSVPVAVMDSMQSVSAKDVADGASYIQIMESNLSVLKEATR